MNLLAAEPIWRALIGCADGSISLLLPFRRHCGAGEVVHIPQRFAILHAEIGYDLHVCIRVCVQHSEWLRADR